MEAMRNTVSRSTGAFDAILESSNAEAVLLALPSARGRDLRKLVAAFPETVDYRQGALIEPTAVAAYGVERAGVAPGDSVLVTGAGPIGALAALCARSAGASTVYISEPNAARRERAEALDVATVLDPTSVDVPKLLHEETDGLGVDVAIDVYPINIL